jgi:hypothetical protein
MACSAETLDGLNDPAAAPAAEEETRTRRIEVVKPNLTFRRAEDIIIAAGGVHDPPDRWLVVLRAGIATSTPRTSASSRHRRRRMQTA